jgi:hypothetical protein
VTPNIDPAGLTPIEIMIKSIGSAFDLRMTETYSSDIRLYDPVTAKWVTDDPWVTEIRLEPGESKRIFYYASAPDKAGTYTLETGIEIMEEGNYEFYESISSEITVDKDTATTSSDIIAALNALSVTGQDKEKVINAIMYIENVQGRDIVSINDIEKNIHDILLAIDSLLFVTSADITDVRQKLEVCLQFWEARWYSD